MIVWRIEGNEIGPNGNGAAYFATKAEALRAKREYLSQGDMEPNFWFRAGPTKMEINGREELAAALIDAMGFGCS